MTRSIRVWAVLGIVGLGLACPLPGWAQEAGGTHGANTETHASSPANLHGSKSAAEALEAGPVLSHDAAWAGTVIAGIAALFAAAFLIGPWVRRELPHEVPPAHSHDEPPGASGHHGPGGTRNPHAHH